METCRGDKESASAARIGDDDDDDKEDDGWTADDGTDETSLMTILDLGAEL